MHTYMCSKSIVRTHSALVVMLAVVWAHVTTMMNNHVPQDFWGKEQL